MVSTFDWLLCEDNEYDALEAVVVLARTDVGDDGVPVSVFTRGLAVGLKVTEVGITLGR
jgi:hypothetical protein